MTQHKTTHYVFPNESIQSLCLTRGTLIKLKKNTVLFDEHSTDRTSCVYYLAEGICSISGISSTGREQIFLYVKAGEMLGHVPFLMPQEARTHLYAYRRPTILAKSNCVLYEIPEKDFLEYLHQNLEFSVYLNQLMAHNYSVALAHLKQMQEESVVSSICRFLLQVSLPAEEGMIVSKMFTYKEISKFLGVHEVTVSKVIGRFKQEAYVKKIPSGLLITDTSSLENLIRHPETFHYK